MVLNYKYLVWVVDPGYINEVNVFLLSFVICIMINNFFVSMVSRDLILVKRNNIYYTLLKTSVELCKGYCKMKLGVFPIILGYNKGLDTEPVGIIKGCCGT